MLTVISANHPVFPLKTGRDGSNKTASATTQFSATETLSQHRHLADISPTWCARLARIESAETSEGEGLLRKSEVVSLLPKVFPALRQLRARDRSHSQEIGFGLWQHKLNIRGPQAFVLRDRAESARSMEAFVSSTDRPLEPADMSDRLRYSPSLHPLHAFLLAGAVTLFVSALLSDIAYFNTAEIQWKNFTSWLQAGGLVFTGLAILWAVADLFRTVASKARALIYAVLLIATFVLGFIDELVHAKDAWATMPEGLVLSAIVAVLAVAATLLGFSSLRAGAMQ
jgi:uncharacterized membrane protein